MKSLMKIASVFMALLLVACGTPPVKSLPVQPPEAQWEWKKWNPIWWAGNDDDAPPQGYSSFGWFLRNPFHNFMFYVLGFADEPVASWPTNENFAPGGGCRFIWVQPEFGLAHPFVSCKGALEFYIGWRTGGAFGVTLRK
jgi:hypothetical protein